MLAVPRNHSSTHPLDEYALDTPEWIDALSAVIHAEGRSSNTIHLSVLRCSPVSQLGI